MQKKERPLDCSSIDGFFFPEREIYIRSSVDVDVFGASKAAMAWGPAFGNMPAAKKMTFNAVSRR